MAAFVRTLVLIVDRVDEAEHSLPIFTNVYPHATGGNRGRWLFAIMAAVTRFRFQIDNLAQFRPLGRKRDFSPFIVDSNSIDSRLFPQSIDNLVDICFPILEHAEVRRAFDRIADAVGTVQDLRHHLVGEEAHGEIGVAPEKNQEKEGTKKEAALESLKPSHSFVSPP